MSSIIYAFLSFVDIVRLYCILQLPLQTIWRPCIAEQPKARMREGCRANLMYGTRVLIQALVTNQ